MPWSSRSCSVLASGRAVTTISWLRASSPMIPAKRLMCGELEISNQIRIRCRCDVAVAFQEAIETVKRIRCQRLRMAHHHHALPAACLVLAVRALQPSRLGSVDRHGARGAGKQLSRQVALAIGNGGAIAPGVMAFAARQLARRQC